MFMAYRIDVYFRKENRWERRRTFTVPEGRHLTVGRAKDADIEIPDAYVSRHAGDFMQQDGGVEYRSTNQRGFYAFDRNKKPQDVTSNKILLVPGESIAIEGERISHYAFAIRKGEVSSDATQLLADSDVRNAIAASVDDDLGTSSDDDLDGVDPLEYLTELASSSAGDQPAENVPTEESATPSSPAIKPKGEK